ncbi:uncharacterized protein TRIADDRAFT_53801 [Trichoplax adhaerens]|uniref:BTB domain-containing protein n=2 Tax=Trichoplax adhaerens TaxID=10228 RepID=B3RQ74_TRIAD|nr:hypothetical protein TRIADDRAFT_53801 [Trichoplax adhaerens]EDV28302.1 hypothetical protein TRIADDRAFT_53801 [Trichoplax adhaerens]|eukprot:XP_002110136.1 hypothetical protein TRIADDRAFT_53801 [Trichoplax adhaerens]
MPELTIKGRLPQSSFQLFQDKIFSDVIIKINDAQFHCHRFVLASFSSYFQAMFVNEMAESQQNIIELKELNEDVFADIIHYFYGVDLKITEKNVQILAITASMLNIMDVVDKCYSFLSEKSPNRSSYGALAIGHKILVFGGITKDNVDILRSIIAFDTCKVRWSNADLAPLPKPIALLSPCLCDNRLYIIGGSHENSSTATNEVAYLESGSDHWVYVSPMNVARNDSVVAVLDNLIYVGGGQNNKWKVRSFERYNPSTDTWELLNWSIPFSEFPDSHVLTVYDGCLNYIWNSCRRRHCHTYNPIQNEWTEASESASAILRFKYRAEEDQFNYDECLNKLFIIRVTNQLRDKDNVK